MLSSASFTSAEQLVARGASPAQAVALWRALRDLYLARRGPAPAGSSVPAVLMADAIDR